MALLDSVLRSNGVAIQESAIGISTVDPDRDKLIEEGFRRLTKTQNERDLMPLEQQRMTEIALFLYDSNPLAKRIIDLVNSFVTGDGFSFNAKNSKVLDVLKRFWDDPVNDWPMKQLDHFRQLSLLGEQLWPVAVRRTDGRVRMGYVDPANIEEIIPDPYQSRDPAHRLHHPGLPSRRRRRSADQILAGQHRRALSGPELRQAEFLPGALWRLLLCDQQAQQRHKRAFRSNHRL